MLLLLPLLPLLLLLLPLLLPLLLLLHLLLLPLLGAALADAAFAVLVVESGTVMPVLQK